MRVFSLLTLAAWVAACGGSSGNPLCKDADRDGYGDGPECISLDCDDKDANVHPGAAEVDGDGKDSDCNFTERCFADHDGDGYRTDGIALSANASCDDPGEALETAPSGDCDDDDALTYPGASELTGDAKDQSCDGREACFRDGDHDGARSTSVVQSSDVDCADVGEALATARIDCDDTSTDDTPYTFYLDADHDHFGLAGTAMIACTEPSGYAPNATDCDDTDGTAWTMKSHFVDEDGDGYGTGTAVSVCSGDVPPPGYATVATDCAPQDPTAHPNAPELPSDGVDQDCAGGDLVMNETNGVFVRQGASDTNPGTRASPVGTLAKARMLATGSKAIFLANGTYTFDVDAVSFDRSMFGGYSNDFSTRSPTGDATIIHATGVLGSSGGALALERMHVDVTDDDSPAAIFAIGMDLTLRDMSITRRGSGMVRGVLGSDATLIADRVRIDLEDGSACVGAYVVGGRLVLLRSRIHTCSGVAGSVFGVLAGNETDLQNVFVLLVGNVIEVGASTGESSAGIRIESARTHAIAAHNTIVLEAMAGTGRMRGFDVFAAAPDVTRVSAVNNIVAASAPVGDVACFEVSSGGDAVVSIEGNDCFVSGAGQCAVSVDHVCVPQASFTACDFDGCRLSAGNLSVDPMFTDPARHIASASMCLDAGVSLVGRVPVSLAGTDVDGNTRPLGAGPDVGADELVP